MTKQKQNEFDPMTYTTYKAELCLMTEDYLDDGSCDPDTFQDHGVVETFKASTLEELVAKVKKSLRVSSFEYDEYNNCFTSSNNSDDGSQHEMYSLHIVEVQTSCVDISKVGIK